MYKTITTFIVIANDLPELLLLLFFFLFSCSFSIHSIFTSSCIAMLFSIFFFSMFFNCQILLASLKAPTTIMTMSMNVNQFTHTNTPEAKEIFFFTTSNSRKISTAMWRTNDEILIKNNQGNIVTNLIDTYFFFLFCSVPESMV